MAGCRFTNNQVIFATNKLIAAILFISLEIRNKRPSYFCAIPMNSMGYDFTILKQD